MERLTERNFEFTSDYIKSTLQSWSIAQALKKLQEYENKEEDGLLIELPYPLETEHIYFADENDIDVYKLDAEKIEVHMMPISKKIMYTIDCYEFFIEDFGKIVFLTEAEAEEALTRIGGNDHEQYYQGNT